MICDFSKISERTNTYYSIMELLQKKAEGRLRYLLGMDGLNRVVLTDMIENISIYGNREIQRFCKAKTEEYKAQVTDDEYKEVLEMVKKYS